MRKVMACLVLLALTLAVQTALCDGLPLAAVPDAHTYFQRYSSYTLDDSGNEWSAHNQFAERLLQTIVRGGAQNMLGKGVCAFYVEARGDINAGLMSPHLKVLYAGKKKLAATGVSIVVDDTRYDFVAKAAAVKLGKVECEEVTLPLDKRGVELLRRIASGEPAYLSIYGDSGIYKTALRELESYSDSRTAFENSAIPALRDMLAQLDVAGLASYDLWDLNEARWNKDMSVRMDVVPLLSSDQFPDSWPQLDDTYQCIFTGDKSGRIKALQEKLRSCAFYYGTIDGQYEAGTISAVKSAQQFYGLPTTGRADARLLDKLYDTGVFVERPSDTVKASVHQISEPSTVARAGESYILADEVELRMDRRWYARTLTPSLSPEQAMGITTSDSDDVFLIADGCVMNISPDTLNLSTYISARLSVDVGHEYPCQVRCERDKGGAFGTELLPLARARLVVFAEIPVSIALSCEAALELKITCFPDQTLIY